MTWACRMGSSNSSRTSPETEAAGCKRKVKFSVSRPGPTIIAVVKDSCCWYIWENSRDDGQRGRTWPAGRLGKQTFLRYPVLPFGSDRGGWTDPAAGKHSLRMAARAGG